LPAIPPATVEVTVHKKLRRLDWRLIGDAILSVFSAESGFGYTIMAFLWRPRQAFEAYLGAERLRFSNPLKLVIFTTAVATFLNYQFGGFDAMDQAVDGVVQSEEEAALMVFFKQNYNLLLLMALPIFTTVSRVFYWQRAYNWVEHLALNGFIYGVTNLIYVLLWGTIQIWPVMNFVYMVLWLVYSVWVWRQTMGPGWFRAGAMVIVSAVLYMLSTGWVGTVIFYLTR
jgi:hypothetical protein